MCACEVERQHLRNAYVPSDVGSARASWVTARISWRKSSRTVSHTSAPIPHKSQRYRHRIREQLLACCAYSSGYWRSLQKGRSTKSVPDKEGESKRVQSVVVMTWRKFMLGSRRAAQY